ncbi:hypothetical protein DYQ86_12565 [Acidobacteria bacterium AB60]|nr:hypothetical protein DYQ86_12565 [Acidobacteria bacterium AB60]
MNSYAACIALSLSLLLPHGCSAPGASEPLPLKYKAQNGSPTVIALYEAWFGHPSHITIGYSSHDPGVITQQIRKAKAMGISAFVVDWYGDREPFIDKSYAMMQNLAEKNKFKIAMMYDETNQEEGATDETIADLTMFRDTYLASNAPGHQAYLTFEGRPVIFVFPKGNHTDWTKVRNVVNSWNPVPLLIQENLPGPDAAAWDGYYAWVQPGPKGWKPDGSDWGEQYLADFYTTMGTKYPDKLIVGGAWSQFDDSKASWGWNRHIAGRCGGTFKDTFNDWRKFFAPNNAPPFLMLETWNDYEEGTALEPGIPNCTNGQAVPANTAGAAEPSSQTPSATAGSQ